MKRVALFHGFANLFNVWLKGDSCSFSHLTLLLWSLATSCFDWSLQRWQSMALIRHWKEDFTEPLKGSQGPPPHFEKCCSNLPVWISTCLWNKSPNLLLQAPLLWEDVCWLCWPLAPLVPAWWGDKESGAPRVGHFAPSQNCPSLRG